MPKRKREATQEGAEEGSAWKHRARKQSYEHQPLDLSKKQIRLFKLTKPADLTAGIEGVLDVYDLDDCPPYMALSYTWERDATEAAAMEDSRTILIDDKTFDIRPNLFDFLEEFRHFSDEVYGRAFPLEGKSNIQGSPFTTRLWIDQLCIDQNAVSERNHQVQMMRNVYMKADRVIIWTNYDAATEQAVASIRSGEYHKSLKYSPEGITVGYSDEVDCLKENHYWTRLWVLQEIIAAKDITVLCGKQYAAWEDVRNLFWLSPESVMQGIMHLSTRDIGQHKKFHAILRSFCSQACKDPRDKVYGLLGLVPERERLGLVADYNVSMETLFVNVIRLVIKADGGGTGGSDLGPDYANWLISLSCKLAEAMGVFLEAHHPDFESFGSHTATLTSSQFNVRDLLLTADSIN